MVIGPRIVVDACIRAAMMAVIIVGRRGRRVCRCGGFRRNRRCGRNRRSRTAFPRDGRDRGSRRHRGCSAICIMPMAVLGPIFPTILTPGFTALAIGLTILAPIGLTILVSVGAIFVPGRLAGLAGERRGGAEQSQRRSTGDGDKESLGHSTYSVVACKWDGSRSRAPLDNERRNPFIPGWRSPRE
jgi:hypothetical protein